MDLLTALFKACLLSLSLFLPSVLSESTTKSTDGVTCPRHQGSDPSDVNDRVQKFANQETYYTDDHDYNYKIAICKEHKIANVAVEQQGKKWPKEKDWVTLGRYEGAHVTGGNDWLMIKYFHGDKYHSHCNKVQRLAVVLVTCDPGVKRGSITVIEEYRNKSSADDPLECYYLFELNNDAACSVQAKHLSPGSIMLIILIVVGTAYLLLGFLYQRYVAGAKGLEQIPNYDFWRDCGSLQADGCNFMCRCSEAHPTRYKTMDDALADDDRDDTLLPM